MTQKLPEALSTQPHQSTAESLLDKLALLEEQIENMGLEGMERLYQTLQDQTDETLAALFAKRLQERNAATAEGHSLSEDKLLSEIFTKRIMHERMMNDVIESLKDSSTGELEERLKRIVERPTTVMEETMEANKNEPGESVDIIKELARDPMATYIDIITVKELALRRALAERKLAENVKDSQAAS